MSNHLYTLPAFNPSTLRVVDLRQILTENNIQWNSKQKKSKLVQIFKSELVPKLLQQERQMILADSIKNPKKRKFRDASLDHINNTYSDVLEARIKRKKLNQQPKGKKDSDNKSDENIKIKAKKGPSHNIDTKIKRKSTLVEGLRKRSIPNPFIKQEKSDSFKSNTNSFQLTQNTTKSNLFDRSAEINFETGNQTVLHRPFEPPIANSTFTEEAYNDSTHSTANDTVNDNMSRTIEDVKPIKLLTGPQKRIDADEIKKDILYKLQQLNTIKQEINNDIELIRSQNNRLLTDASTQQNDTTNGVNTTEHFDITDNINSQSSIGNLTFENDSEFFSRLEKEIDLENTRIEVESEKVLNMINSKEKLKFYKSQFIKIIPVWLAVFTFSFAVALYRTERIRVGFCGAESTLKRTFFGLSLKCVECPHHALCFPNSKLQCLPDYIVSKPIFWSFWGLIPTYNKCILDATKIKKINKIVKSVMNLLNVRNASINCGRSNDDEAGLSWDQIRELVDSQMLLDLNDPFYKYYWDKVKLILSTKIDIRFTNRGEASELLRSTSTSKLSINCRLKLMMIAILLKYKAYFISVLLLVSMLMYIFYQVNEIQRRKEVFKFLEKETIKQLKLKRKPIAKIQLRDSFLDELNKLSKKNRDLVWKKVVKSVEKNSNVHVEDKEINGDIMRVWTWSSPV